MLRRLWVALTGRDDRLPPPVPDDRSSLELFRRIMSKD